MIVITVPDYVEDKQKSEVKFFQARRNSHCEILNQNQVGPFKQKSVADEAEAH